MIDPYKYQQLRIGSVSPQQISAWAKKILPNGEIVGEVTKPYTFHYKTNKPEKDGLFCERIFGPIKSGICACGNYRVIGDKAKNRYYLQSGALRRELLLLLSTYVILSLRKLFPTVKPSRAPSPTRLANMLPGLVTIRKEGKANHRDHLTRAERRVN